MKGNPNNMIEPNPHPQAGLAGFITWAVSMSLGGVSYIVLQSVEHLDKITSWVLHLFGIISFVVAIIVGLYTIKEKRLVIKERKEKGTPKSPNHGA